MGTTAHGGCPSTVDGWAWAFGSTLEQAIVSVLGVTERGAKAEKTKMWRHYVEPEGMPGARTWSWRFSSRAGGPHHADQLRHEPRRERPSRP